MIFVSEWQCYEVFLSVQHHHVFNSVAYVVPNYFSALRRLWPSLDFVELLLNQDDGQEPLLLIQFAVDERASMHMVYCAKTRFPLLHTHTRCVIVACNMPHRTGWYCVTLSRVSALSAIFLDLAPLNRKLLSDGSRRT